MRLKAVQSTPDFESKLKQCATEEEINFLVAEINSSIKLAVNDQEKASLQYIRQNAYNKKKKIIKEGNRNGHMGRDALPVVDSVALNRSIDTYTAKPIAQKRHEEDRRGDSAQEYLRIAKIWAPRVFFGACATTTAGFIWFQSVPIYATLGFPAPEWSAAGAMLLIAGAAIVHALTRSKIVLLLCLYASAYEVTLIVQGTFKDETTIVHASTETNSDVQFLKEKAARDLTAYNISKEKYEDPSSSVFQNAWYRQKAVDPAWNKYAADKKEIDDKMHNLLSESDTNKTGMLKVMFRLGLVFLCMISMHFMLKKEKEE